MLSFLCRLQSSTTREQRNGAVLMQLQQSSEARFLAMQDTFSNAMSNAQSLVEQSVSQLASYLQGKDQEAVKLQANLIPCYKFNSLTADYLH